MVETKIRPIPAGDASSIIIHDNSSEIAKIIPEKYVETLVIIARIQGFDGIDDFIIHLIKDRLEMFTDATNCNYDLYNSFQEYIHNMVKGRDFPNTWSSPNSAKTKEEEEETTAADDATTGEIEDDINEEKDLICFNY